MHRSYTPTPTWGDASSTPSISKGDTGVFHVQPKVRPNQLASRLSVLHPRLRMVRRAEVRVERATPRLQRMGRATIDRTRPRVPPMEVLHTRLSCPTLPRSRPTVCPRLGQQINFPGFPTSRKTNSRLHRNSSSSSRRIRLWVLSGSRRGEEVITVLSRQCTLRVTLLICTLFSIGSMVAHFSHSTGTF